MVGVAKVEASRHIRANIVACDDVLTRPRVRNANPVIGVTGDQVSLAGISKPIAIGSNPVELSARRDGDTGLKIRSRDTIS